MQSDQLLRGMKKIYLFFKNTLNKALQVFGYIFFFFVATNQKKSKRIANRFVQDFAVSVLFDKKHYSYYGLIESHRKKLEKEKTLIEMKDIGAGSKVIYSNRKTIERVAKCASVNRRTGRLLYRMAYYYQPDKIIELGTSLGISTLYLAAGCPSAKIITIEADHNLAALASGYFTNLGMNNINVINKSFDEALQMFPAKIYEKSIVFIDGNHQKKAVIGYVSFFSSRLREGSMIIIDDINWSAGMRRAWEEIRSDQRYSVAIDLFYLGIIFPGENIKENYQMRF